MSRRISLLALAAIAALTATPAAADSDCFENSCRMPDVVDPPAAVPEPVEVAPPPQIERGRTMVTVTSPATETVVRPAITHTAEEPRLQRPPLQPPQHFSEQPKREPVKPVARRLPPPEPLRAAPEPQQSDRVATRSHAVTEPARVPASYGVGQNAPRVVSMRMPAALYADDAVAAPVYLAPRPDPAWKACQTESRQQGHCGPYSYRPYGSSGYRPYGERPGYVSTPMYVFAPDARIIHIETDDD